MTKVMYDNQGNIVTPGKLSEAKAHYVKTGQGITSPRLVDAAIRMQATLDLRAKAWTYEIIAQTIIKRFGLENLPAGYDSRYAAKDVMRYLGQMRREMAEDASTIVDMEVLRLDALYNAHVTQALNGNVRATEMCLRIAERRSRLLGLDQPVKVSMDFRTILIEKVRLGQLDVGQLRKEMGEDYFNELMAGVDQRLLVGLSDNLQEDQLSDNEDMLAEPEAIVDADWRPVAEAEKATDPADPVPETPQNGGLTASSV